MLPGESAPCIDCGRTVTWHGWAHVPYEFFYCSARTCRRQCVCSGCAEAHVAMHDLAQEPYPETSVLGYIEWKASHTKYVPTTHK